MYRSVHNHSAFFIGTVVCIVGVLLCLLTACGPENSATTKNVTPTVTPPNKSTPITIIATQSTPGVGPTVIQAPSPIVGGSTTTHSQQIVLTSRVLFITDVHRATDVVNDTVAIRLTMTLKNTGARAIVNMPSYFSLFGAEGDAFGLTSSSTNPFFGPINANSSRSGTVVFQVPLGAAKTLRLFYRSEVAHEAVFVPIAV